MPPRRVRSITHLPVTLELRTTDLPKGVCGQLSGLLLPYDTTDWYGTQFAPGCLDRTKAEKVATGRVKLFADHGEYMPKTRAHVGVVRDLPDLGGACGMLADLFDTEDGRRMKEYLAAVLDAQAKTGLSIGFYDRASEWITEADGTRVLRYSEIELDEASITPSPAVPGADVLGVRGEVGAGRLAEVTERLLSMLPDEDRRAVLARVGDAAGQSDSPSQGGDAGAEDSPAGATVAPPFATMEERLAAFRRTYAP